MENETDCSFTHEQVRERERNFLAAKDLLRNVGIVHGNIYGSEKLIEIKVFEYKEISIVLSVSYDG